MFIKRIFVTMRNFLADRFSLNDDKADEQVIVEDIKSEVSFKGTNVWTLIFAIFIASIGLNVNSPAVIIGAMLISPLMGPIVGIGLSIGINDLDLLKKGLRNLLIAAIISVFTSFLYFTITPLHEASSELLARTTPTIWDVFIAFLGGLAGIVAGTRKKKSNVVPGVAIATALMPPLCTAGFGLATGQWYYFLGAVYLFFINSLFICLATFMIVKRLKFRKVEFSSSGREKRVSRYMLVITILTILPSIYLAYRIVQKSIFEANARKFVLEQFHFTHTQVVTKNFLFNNDQRTIELLLVGQELPASFFDSARTTLPAYDLEGAKLVVYQGLDAKQKIDLSSIKASVLEELYAGMSADTSLRMETEFERQLPDLRKELKALYPALGSYSIVPVEVIHMDTSLRDTMILFTGAFRPPLPEKEKAKISEWLKQRIKADTMKFVFE